MTRRRTSPRPAGWACARTGSDPPRRPCGSSGGWDEVDARIDRPGRGSSGRPAGVGRPRVARERTPVRDVRGRSSPSDPLSPRPAGYAPAISRRSGQVVVVSPFPFQAAFDCALSSTVGETPHPVGQGLLPGRRPFHHIPREPPVHHLHRPLGLCRFCSGARTLARRAPTRPRVSRRGDFPQRPAVVDADHRQLPSTSWREAGHARRVRACRRPGGSSPPPRDLRHLRLPSRAIRPTSRPRGPPPSRRPKASHPSGEGPGPGGERRS